jgi:hypothetical protein
VDARAITIEEEDRLRELAYGLAKGIEEPEELLERLKFSAQDYATLSDTRTFRAMLDQAYGEWQGANGIVKRIRLKAQLNIEEAMPKFYDAMVDMKENLASRVKALEALMRLGGLGTPENEPAMGGSGFHLSITLAKDKPAIVIDGGVGAGVSVQEESVAREERPAYSQSKKLAERPVEEL